MQQQQQQQQRLSEQQDMCQLQVWPQQTLLPQAHHKRTQGGDPVVVPNEFKTTTLVNTQHPDKSLVEQLHRETGMDIHKLQILENQGLLVQIPRSDKGNISSIGSTKHDTGECSPCLFWFKNQCAKGLLCDYCHFRHSGQKNKRIRPSKRSRMQMRMSDPAPGS